MDGNWLCVVMEYAPYGDLSRFIKKGAELRRLFPEEIIWKFFLQVLLGVAVRTLLPRLEFFKSRPQ